MVDYLSNFSAGQVPVNLRSIEHVRRLLEDLSCTVYDSFNWSGMREGMKLRLTQVGSTSDSSEHLVFFAKLGYESVVVKFHIRNGRITTMSEQHCRSIIKNYNSLNSTLATGGFRNVHVVAVCIVRVFDKINLWVEKDVGKANWRKFWKTNPQLSHVERLAGTDERELQKLQDYIYDQSQNRYTVCDLQGSYTGGHYTLGDIEFTNTLTKFNMDPETLLKAYLRCRQSRRQVRNPSPERIEIRPERKIPQGICRRQIPMYRDQRRELERVLGPKMIACPNGGFMIMPPQQLGPFGYPVQGIYGVPGGFGHLQFM